MLSIEGIDRNNIQGPKLKLQLSGGQLYLDNVATSVPARSEDTIGQCRGTSAKTRLYRAGIAKLEWTAMQHTEQKQELKHRR